MAEHRPPPAAAAALGGARSQERTGMCTTALGGTVGERIIGLYYAGRSHAGEHGKALLERREAERDTPRGMADALSRKEGDETTVMRCPWLAHGWRQCRALEDVCPMECQVVIDTLTQGFAHDGEARDQQMSPAAR